MQPPTAGFAIVAGKVFLAYTVFYIILTLVFSTCYSVSFSLKLKAFRTCNLGHARLAAAVTLPLPQVMYATLPDRADGPKTSFILNPGKQARSSNLAPALIPVARCFLHSSRVLLGQQLLQRQRPLRDPT